MSEQYNGKNFTENESGLLVPENTLHKPTKAEISGYGNKPNYLSEQNDGELIKDQMQKEADEKAYKEILNPANVIELKQSIEVAQGRVGTKSDTANMGLNLKREKEAIRSKLIEEYLHTGDRDNNRTITDEVRQKLEEMLRQSYARLESDMNAEISNADNTEAENEEEPTTEANTVNSKEDDK